MTVLITAVCVLSVTVLILLIVLVAYVYVGSGDHADVLVENSRLAADNDRLRAKRDELAAQVDRERTLNDDLINQLAEYEQPDDLPDQYAVSRPVVDVHLPEA